MRWTPSRQVYHLGVTSESLLPSELYPPLSLTKNGDPVSLCYSLDVNCPSQASVELWVPNLQCCFRRWQSSGGGAWLEAMGDERGGAFESYDPTPGPCCSLLADPP